MLVRNVKYARKTDHNVYIGRGNEVRKRSVLSNPFWIRNQNDEQERKESIEQYRAWLWKKLQSPDPKESAPIWEALRSIRPTSVLLCHCYPKNCHGWVVKAAWEWAYKQGLIEPVWINKTDDRTAQNKGKQSYRNVHKPLHSGMGPSKAYGPLDLPAIPSARKVELDENDLRRLDSCTANAKLDEDILDTMPSNALQRTLPPKKKQGRGAPRKPRGIVYSTPDTRYNALDDMQADIADLPQEYRWTETVWTAPVHAAA